MFYIHEKHVIFNMLYFLSSLRNNTSRYQNPWSSQERRTWYLVQMVNRSRSCKLGTVSSSKRACIISSFSWGKEWVHSLFIFFKYCRTYIYLALPCVPMHTVYKFQKSQKFRLVFSCQLEWYGGNEILFWVAGPFLRVPFLHAWFLRLWLYHVIVPVLYTSTL